MYQMHSSYSLHIPQKSIDSKSQRKRKRKVIPIISHQYESFKYRCMTCLTAVYFTPGHELVCPSCASRTVEKINENPKERIIQAR